MRFPIPAQGVALAMLIALNQPAHAAAAHVHGAANLQATLEGDTFVLALESPLDGLLGFERAPRGAAEQDKVRRMAASLRAADKVFVLSPDAGCTLAGVKLASAALDPALLGEAGPAAKPAAGEHADLDAEFAFRCRRPDALRSLTVQLFDAFPGLRRLDVQLVTPKRQQGARLDPSQRRLEW